MIRYVLRPCWVAGLAWLIVSLVCPWLSIGWRVALMVIAAVALVVSLCIRRLRNIHALPLIAAVCLLAAVAYQLAYSRRIEPTESCVGQPISLDVQVAEIGDYALLKVQGGALPKGTQVVFYPSEEFSLEPYDCFTATVVLETYSSGSQLASRAYGRWLRVDTVDIAQIEATLTRGDVPWTAIFTHVRRRLVADIEKQLDGDIGAVVAGICYGADDRLSDRALSNFRACGVSHLFAVSGLHMTVLLQGLLYLLRRLRVNRMWRSVIGAVLLVCFMAIVGFSASVVRAGVVCLIMLLGMGLRRRADARNSLGLALLVLLVPDPFAAYDAGLLLSFSATYGLLCWSSPLTQWLVGREPKRFLKLRKMIAAAVAVSLAAMLATLPVLALCFGRVSLVSIPANLLTTLAAEVVLITGCVSSLLSVVALSLVAQPLLMVAGLLSRYLLWICEKISAFLPATVAIRGAFLLLWVIGTSALLFIGYRVLSRRGLAALCGACACTLCVGLLLNRGAVYHTLRIAAASDTDELAVALSYRGSTVAVTAPNSTASLCALGNALDDLGAVHLDVLLIIGGEEPAISHIPLVLADYLIDGTQVFYGNLPWESPLAGTLIEDRRLTLGRSLSALCRQGQLTVDWNGQVLLFETQQELSDTADAVFSTGDTRIWLRTDDGLQPLAAKTDRVMLKDEQWYIGD